MKRSMEKDSDIKMTDDGIEYKEYTIPGIDEEENKIVKLYNTPIPKRLPYETREEYKIRRRILNYNKRKTKRGILFWDSSIYGTLKREEDGKQEK